MPEYNCCLQNFEWPLSGGQTDDQRSENKIHYKNEMKKSKKKKTKIDLQTTMKWNAEAE